MPTFPPLPNTEIHTDQEKELQRFDAPPLLNNGLFSHPFSFEGRISKGEFALTHLIIPLYFAAFYFVSIYADISSLFIGREGADATFNQMLWGNLFVACWFYTAQGVKRCHDIGWSGWRIYIPFLHILLLFKRGSGTINRFGLPPTRVIADDTLRTKMSTLRRRSIICGILWLACSPVWFVLAWKWRIQHWPARLILFFVSPFVITSIYTTKVVLKNNEAAEVRKERVINAIGQNVTGTTFSVAEIKEVRSQNVYCGETYTVELKEEPSAALLNSLEGLAKKQDSGWKAFTEEALATDEDYGYYREDYLTPSDSLAALVPNTVYLFTKKVKLKDEKNESIVKLLIRKDETQAGLTIIPQQR